MPPQPPRKRMRTSRRQRAHLVETLHANLDIVRATDNGLIANAKVVEFWTKLTRELNFMSRKCARNVNGWQQAWGLWCKKLRTKCRRISVGLQAINGGLSTEENLTEVEMKIFDIISKTEYDWRLSNQSQAGGRKEKLDSTSCLSESTDFGSSYRIENKQEEMASSAKLRKSVDTSTPSQTVKVECRICLEYVHCDDECCDIFGPWNQNPEATISCYFTQVTNIQVSPSDSHTKYICYKCLAILKNCVLFIEKALNSEAELQKRYEFPTEHVVESLWPKPIQVDKCLNNENRIEVEVKQEVLSEEDIPAMETDNEDHRMDIKVEPEEYSSYNCSPQIMDTISITALPEDEVLKNSNIITYEDENYLEEHIKEEPQSDNESEVTPDLPLDCMLCTKTFHSVSGLKAHVIAQHSYLTIARKTEVTPPIYQCFTCRRTFFTHTDLIVHETCHGEYACYMCNSKFETFMLLTKHRKRCRNNGDHVSRLKTLEDVQRPSPDPQNTETADVTSKKPDSTNIEPEQKMHDAKTGHLTIKELQPSNTSKNLTNTELESQKMHYAKTGDLVTKESQPSNTSKNSTNTELESEKMHDAKTGHLTTKELQPSNTLKNSTNTELESQKMHYAKTGDLITKESQPSHTSKNSTNTELESQKMHYAKTGDLITKESQPLNTSKNSTNTELESQKMHYAKIRGSTKTELKSQKTHHTNTSGSSNTGLQSRKRHRLKAGATVNTESHLHHSKTAHSINIESIESLAQKIYLVKAADPKELESDKIYYVEAAKPTVTEKKKIQQAVVTYILDSRRSGSVKTTYDNSLQDKPITEEKKSIAQKNNADSEEKNLDFKVHNHNSGNNLNLDFDNPNSEINDSNCPMTYQNQDLETQSTESEDFNLTYNSSNDTNEDLNSPNSETNIKIELSNDPSQGRSLYTNSISPILQSGGAEMDSRNINVEFNNDHISASENIESEQSNLALDIGNVSGSCNSVSKNSNLESVLEVNKTECANISLEVSKHSIENTPHIVMESDSMKIHLAIRSLKKKSSDNLNDMEIDEDVIETTESNDDKVIQ